MLILQDRGWVADFIGIDIAGDIEIRNKIKELPGAAADEGVETANVYILDIERAYAPSHKGEPFQWQSEKQRRAAFAKMREQGGPPYSRTQTMRSDWRTVGEGRNQIVVNDGRNQISKTGVNYAVYVKDPPIPGHAQREWTSISQDVVTHLSKILAKFAEGVRKGIRKVGL